MLRDDLPSCVLAALMLLLLGVGLGVALYVAAVVGAPR
jgi:small basic protein